MRKGSNFNIKKSVFSNGSSGGDLVSPVVFQGLDGFRKTSTLSLRWWWGENSGTEIAFQEDPQHAPKNRLNSCFLQVSHILGSFQNFIHCISKVRV